MYMPKLVNYDVDNILKVANTDGESLKSACSKIYEDKKMALSCWRWLMRHDLIERIYRRKRK